MCVLDLTASHYPSLMLKLKIPAISKHPYRSPYLNSGRSLQSNQQRRLTEHSNKTKYFHTTKKHLSWYHQFSTLPHLKHS
ncbi:unnamed protein product [Heterobilharzia americana]|nr:unnamed protein product [Heterobilharzia americana]